MKWEAKAITHNKEKRIAIYFEKDAILIARIKQLSGIRWSDTLKAWHLPDNAENRERFKIAPKLHLNDAHAVKIASFEAWLISRRYSVNTIKTYTEALCSFLLFYNHMSLEAIENEHVIKYNHEYIHAKKLSASFQNQVVNAIKLFFSTIVQKKLDPTLLHRPKTAKTLPNVLSKEEVKMILEAHTNLKHRVMLSMIYSCGLRRNELLNLKLSDIDSRRNVVIIRQSKGKKDRIVPLSLKILQLLREYYSLYKTKTWLFEGHHSNERYDERSLSNVLKQALEKANIKKPVTLHWLRHSYATHLLEAGTDLRYIQEILGHSSSRTTEIYTHVSTKSIQNIKSPFDDL